jgi:transcriptional regulator with XRE-family HTH domain
MMIAKEAEAPARRKPRRTRGKPTDVDLYVGRRIRQRRQLLGLSQTKLADALEVTFQQVQKYERGSNRVGAGRLFQLSRVLDVPVAYFFDNLDQADDQARPAAASELTREHANLLRAFDGIEDNGLRHRLVELIKDISRMQDGSKQSERKESAAVKNSQDG